MEVVIVYRNFNKNECACRVKYIHSILYHVFVGSIIYFPLTCSLRKAKIRKRHNNNMIAPSYNKERQESRISPKGKSQQCGSSVGVEGGPLPRNP